MNGKSKEDKNISSDSMEGGISWATDVMSVDLFTQLSLTSSVLNYSFNFMYSSLSANFDHAGVSFYVETKYFLTLIL